MNNIGIKICGITRREDLSAAKELGVDAVGVNFFEQSPRFVSSDQARPFRSATAPMLVGVFVNAKPAGIAKAIEAFGLQALQIHGDEPPDTMVELPNIPVIRARRIDDRGIGPIAEDLAACRAAGRQPDAVLVDAMTPGRYGGTGRTVSWTALADYRQWLGELPLILAGGLTPENVGEAIHTVRPTGVDVASGVESAPGIKDHAKMQSFVEEATAAFAAIQS
ncbi:MAG: phosphoribosylanthranilate isomerase [Pirellulales bacterium]|nr:phosphoribosylanthranilate isomerase [Pirellulales bacterium]